MLDKVKALNQARKMQSQIKKQLREIYLKEEKGDLMVLVRGDKVIEELTIDGEDRKDVKDFLNDAMKNVDKKVEKKMRDQSGDIMEMMGL
jgi:DNA-binding protein YbaB